MEGHSSLGRVVSFGSAAHLEPARAVHKALVEAAHGRMFVKSLLREQPLWRAGRHFARVTSFADHARFYSVHAECQRPLVRWWNSPHVSRRFADAAAHGHDSQQPLKQLTSRLRAAGYDAYAVDLTTRDIRPVGLHVARVLVPGLQPLHGHHNWPHLGGLRLRALSRVFGPSVKTPWRWNRYPHPCP
jgi:ribosomal protein S12 methylthiotransferase accessory factor